MSVALAAKDRYSWALLGKMWKNAHDQVDLSVWGRTVEEDKSQSDPRSFCHGSDGSSPTLPFTAAQNRSTVRFAI